MNGKEIYAVVRTYKSLQKIRLQLYNRVVAFVKNNYDEIKSKLGLSDEKETEKLYAKVADMIIEAGIVYDEIEMTIRMLEKVREAEDECYRMMREVVKEHPFWEEYLSRIKGIGPAMGAVIIGWLGPLSRFSTVSKLWKYCGLAPGQRRVKGQRAGYNVLLKSQLYVLGQSLLRANGWYKQLYDYYKKICEEKHPDWRKAKRHMWAQRKVIKKFLSHAWEMWWKIVEGKEPPTKPYPIDILKHADYLRPRVDKPEIKELR